MVTERGLTSTVRFDHPRLHDQMKAFVIAPLRSGPFKFDQCDSGRKPCVGVCLRTRHVELTELPKSRAVAFRDARSDSFEIAIMGQENAVTILRHFRDKRIR